MAGMATIQDGATTGYIVDALEIRALIEETERLSSTVVKPFRSAWSDLPCADPADS